MKLKTLSASTITPDCSPSIYKSANHTETEAAAVKDMIHGVLSKPPQDLYAFSHYATLAADSQQIPPQHRHIVRIPHWLADKIQLLQTQWCYEGALKARTFDDTLEDMSSLPKAKETFKTLFTNDNAWSMRLTDISPKDSPTRMPVRSLRQLLTILSTSSRAQWELENRIRNNEEINLYLRPWDEGMGKGVEFRVFVPPPPPPTHHAAFHISAISQYSWHKPLPPLGNMTVVGHLANLALDGAHKVLEDIVRTAAEAKTIEGLTEWGLSFDVVVKADGRVQFVEANPFGVASETGSCLFHWIGDAAVLYGKNSCVEVRVLV